MGLPGQSPSEAKKTVFTPGGSNGPGGRPPLKEPTSAPRNMVHGVTDHLLAPTTTVSVLCLGVLTCTSALHLHTAAWFPNGKESRGPGSYPRAPPVLRDGGPGLEAAHLTGEAGDAI